MFDLILKALLKYIEGHPQVIEQLIDAAVKALIEQLNKPKVG